MTFEDAVKSSDIYARLRAEAKQPTYSYMIVSPDTVTTELCAKMLVEFLTGLSDVEQSKDVYMLPFGDKVLTSDADFINTTAYIMPTQLSKKFFIVRSVETANESSQNKLLKTLEEPPETAVIILLCANENAILPTVKSRCRILRPRAYSDDVLKKVLEEEYYGTENPSFVIAVSSGNLSRLKAAAESGTEAFDFALRMLECMRRSSEILPYAAELTAKKGTLKLPDVLDAIELILRDCMVYAYKPSLIKLKDNVMDIKELAASYTPSAVVKVMPVILRARRRTNSDGNTNSIVDELLFSILEEKAKCLK